MQRETSSGEKFAQKLSFAIHKSRYVLIGFLAALIVIVVTWVVVSEVRSKRIESSTILVEAAEKKLEQLLGEEDEARITGLGEELVTDLERIIDEYPRLYAGQRALYLLGSYYFNSEEWELSKEAFLKLADGFPKSYLSPVGRINAAVAMEEAGDYEEAIRIYEQVVEKHADASPEIPRVLFSLGRLSEKKGSTDAALEYYNSIVDDYGSSGWTNLAQDRIIYLNLD